MAKKSKKKKNEIPVRSTTDKIVLAGVFVSIGLTLPFITGQIPTVGNMLLPMHIPVLLCGYVLGWKYGLTVGFITPIIASLLFKTPALYPFSIIMAFELMTYGFITGLLYRRTPRSNLNTSIILMIAMLSGRIVWGVTVALLSGFSGMTFTREAFVAGAFTSVVPGIMLQIILIPILVLGFEKAGIIRNEVQ